MHVDGFAERSSQNWADGPSFPQFWSQARWYVAPATKTVTDTTKLGFELY